MKTILDLLDVFFSIFSPILLIKFYKLPGQFVPYLFFCFTIKSSFVLFLCFLDSKNEAPRKPENIKLMQ